jgi:hypothetical protein
MTRRLSARLESAAAVVDDGSAEAKLEEWIAATRAF